MKLKHLLFAGVILLAGQSVFAQAPGYSWVKGCGPTAASIRPSVATDLNNNVIFAGNYIDTLRVGSTTLINTEGGSKAFTVKYDPAGNVLWARASKGNSYSDVACVATDAAGDVYVTGVFNGDTTFFGAVTLFNLGSGGSENMFIVKYDPSGNVLWAKVYGDGTDDTPETVSVAPDGSLFFTGEFRIRTTIGTTTLVDADSTGSTGDIFIAKVNAAGNVLWVKSAGTNNSLDEVRGVSDASGNLVIAGEFSSSSIVFGTIMLTNPSPGQDEIFVAKYNAAGNPLWAKRFGGTGEEEAVDVATDASNNIYISGQYDSPSLVIGPSTITNSGAGYEDLYIAKLDASGNGLWARSAGGSLQELATSVAIDQSGNCFITGDFMSGHINFGGATPTLINTDTSCSDCSDIFVTKYDAAGNALWAKRAGGSLQDFTSGLATDHLGNVIACGQFYSAPVSFDAMTLTPGSAGDPDLYVVKIDNVTGIMEYAAQDVSVSIYPNPNTGVFSVTADATVFKIEVLNVLGELVYSSETGYVLNAGQKAELNIGEQPAGIYFVRLRSEKGTGTKKVTLYR